MFECIIKSLSQNRNRTHWTNKNLNLTKLMNLNSVVDLNPWHICSFAPKTLIITLRYDTKMIKHCVSSLAKYKCIKLYAWRAYMHCINVDICVSKVVRWHCIHNQNIPLPSQKPNIYQCLHISRVSSLIDAIAIAIENAMSQ